MADHAWVTLPIVGDVELALATPARAIEEDANALPPIEVSGVPGAVVVARRSLRDGGLVVRAACVRAPSDRWAPGLQGLVLDRATAIAAATAPGLQGWSGGGPAAIGDRFEQRLAAAGSIDGAAARGVMRHFLGFGGPARDVALCSIVCVEPAPEARCGDLVDAGELRGALVAPPPPSLWVRAIIGAAERPRGAALVAALLAIAAITVVLARRPKPRR